MRESVNLLFFRDMGTGQIHVSKIYLMLHFHSCTANTPNSTEHRCFLHVIQVSWKEKTRGMTIGVRMAQYQGNKGKQFDNFCHIYLTQKGSANLEKETANLRIIYLLIWKLKKLVLISCKSRIRVCGWNFSFYFSRSKWDYLVDCIVCTRTYPEHTSFGIPTDRQAGCNCRKMRVDFQSHPPRCLCRRSLGRVGAATSPEAKKQVGK